MPFEITIRASFSAAHQIWLPDGSLEPLHGHDWHVRLVATRADGGLDEIETVHDFHDLEARLEKVIGPMRNRHLNELSAFETRNTSAERVAEYIGQAIEMPPGVLVKALELTEAPGCSALWRP